MNTDKGKAEEKKSTRRRYAGIFDDDNGGDDVSLESALEASKMKPYSPKIQYVEWEDGDYLEIELPDNEANDIEPKNEEGQSKFKVGQTVRVKPHTRYQHLKGGAVITPLIKHEMRGGQVSVIRNIFVERFEDEHGTRVDEEVIEVTNEGLFAAGELEIVNQ